MDPMYMAMRYYRLRKFDECIDVCSKLLKYNPLDQQAWALKTRALTEQMYIDEVEMDEEGIAEMLDDNAIADVLTGAEVRPGTSLKKPGTARSGNGPTPAMRPMSQSGRPTTGFVRPGTQSGRPGTMERAIKTPRTALTARPVTSASGRYVRLGTASMLSQPDGPFINLARINFQKYAARPNLAKTLFEYILHHENDARNALSFATLALAADHVDYKDWWWRVQLGKCHYRLGLYREAEKQLKAALKHAEFIDVYLYLSKVYVKLDQPLPAIEVLKQGLAVFPAEATLLTGMARIYDELNDSENMVKYYKEVLQTDNTHIEAISCIATNHFYSDQPEVGLVFFRRLLQMGVYNTEIFNNIGLCCFYAQQYDMSLSCFERALSLATDEYMADIWYNISHVAIGVGDLRIAYQCLRIALVSDNDHAEAYNNLGVIECKRGNFEDSRSHFQTAIALADFMYEPHYNNGRVSEKVGDFQTAYKSAKSANDLYDEHSEGKSLIAALREQLSAS